MKWVSLICLLFFLPACEKANDDCSQETYTPVSVAEFERLSLFPPQVSKDITYFRSCTEIIDHTIKRWESQQAIYDLESNYYLANDYQSISNNSCPVNTMFTNQEGAPQSGTGDQNQPTNTQESEIDESDKVKISRNYIFYSRENSVEVISRHTHEFVKSIPVNGNWAPYIYVFDEKLIVIRSHAEPFLSDEDKNSDIANSILPIYVRNPEKFEVVVYDVSAKIFQISKKTVVGNYINSRLNSAGILTLITRSKLVPDYSRKKNRDHIKALLSYLDCSTIAKPGVSDLDFGLTSVHTFNANHRNFEQKQTHLAGTYDNVYMRDNLYLTKSNVDWFWWDSRNTFKYNSKFTTRLDLIGKKWTIQSHFDFHGQILGEWSFKEIGDYFFIATTENAEPGAEFATHLEVFKNVKNDTQRITHISGIAPGERLRSARFTDDYAYLVTFRDYDPLFVIDLKEKENPKIVSELKIPGFSTYLHATNDRRLIGVGVAENFQKAQISLFDVKNPLAPRTLQQIALEGDYSSSTAQYEHHSFFYNDEWQTLAIPISTNSYNSSWQLTESQTGAYFYDLSHNKINKIGHATHKDWMVDYCDPYPGTTSWASFPGEKDITRIHRIDNHLMTFSDFGARVHDLANPSTELKQTLFANPQEVCPRPYGICGVYD